MSFQIQMNLSGVTPGGGGGELDEGFYKGFIQKVSQAENSTGSSRLVFTVGNIEGNPGAVRTTSITLPNANTKPGLLKVWRGAMESMGYNAAQLDAGGIMLTPETFLNRPVHFYYKPGDRDTGIYDELNMLTPADWNTRKASFEKPSHNGGSALGGQPAQAQQSAPVQNFQGQAQSFQGQPNHGMQQGFQGQQGFQQGQQPVGGQQFVQQGQPNQGFQQQGFQGQPAGGQPAGGQPGQTPAALRQMLGLGG